jgi:hypothetical protein
MKLYLIVPALAAVALVACSKETSAPVTSPTAATTASASAPAEVNTLTHLPDQLTAEEIQGRREAWVSRPNATVESRVAAAPAPSRE